MNRVRLGLASGLAVIRLLGGCARRGARTDSPTPTGPPSADLPEPTATTVMNESTSPTEWADCADLALPALVMVPPLGPRTARSFILVSPDGDELCTLSPPRVPWSSAECQVVGKRVFCWDEERNALQALRVGEGTLEYIRPESGLDPGHPDFLVSPDGDRIVWSVTEPDGDNGHGTQIASRCRIVITQSDGTAGRTVLEVTKEDSCHLLPLAWTSDRETIFLARVLIEGGGAFVPTFPSRYSELHQLDFSTGELRRVVPFEEGESCSRCIGDISPDGRWLAYHTGDGSLIVRDLTAGEERTVAGAGSARSVCHARFSPNGRHLVYTEVEPGRDAPDGFDVARTLMVAVPFSGERQVLADSAEAVDWATGWLDDDTPIFDRIYRSFDHRGYWVDGQSAAAKDLLPGVLIGVLAENPTSAFPASEAALTDYDPLHDASAVVEALSEEIAAWLSEGHEPAVLSDILRTLPKLDSADLEVDVVDSTGDGQRDVVLQPQTLGLPVLACLEQTEKTYTCHPLPAPNRLASGAPAVRSGVVSQDLLGDGHPETVITYTVQGGSSWTELVYVFDWEEMRSPRLVFHATLVNWAGASRWELEPEPGSPGRRQMVLTYPHLYDHGFDHKMVNHPVGRQVWRWDGQQGRFVVIEEGVDMSKSGWGPEREITAEDQIRWLTNAAETAFRSSRFDEALKGCDKALAFAAKESWGPATDQPDWVGFLRFRRAQTLARLGRAVEAQHSLEAVGSEYAGDLLGELAAAFLAGYGAGSGPDPTEAACAALQTLDERLRDHFHRDGEGALQFPTTASGVLWCEPHRGSIVEPVEPSWPHVGEFDPDLGF